MALLFLIEPSPESLHLVWIFTPSLEAIESFIWSSGLPTAYFCPYFDVSCRPCRLFVSKYFSWHMVISLLNLRPLEDHCQNLLEIKAVKFQEGIWCTCNQYFADSANWFFFLPWKMLASVRKINAWEWKTGVKFDRDIMHLMFGGQRVLSTNSSNSVRCNMWGINERVRNKSSEQKGCFLSPRKWAAYMKIMRRQSEGVFSTLPCLDRKSTETTISCFKALVRDMRVCSVVQ